MSAEVMAVELRANFAQFEKALLRAQNQTDAKLASVEKRFARTNARVRDETKGLGSVFGDLSRSVGGFGAGLPNVTGGVGALGIAGGVAAVGVGALVASLHSLKGAAQFADALGASADRIGVTAEALQELRFAADETDVEISTLESGLESLNAALGAYKTGIGAGRIKPVFEALGLSKADLVGVENARDLLPILADRLGQVSDRATQVQLAKKLGADGLLPLLRQGSDGINRMAGEARGLGLVLSEDVVKGLSETDRALERSQQQIDANVREMQSSMAPFFVWATNELARLSRGIGDLFNGIRSVENQTDRVLENRITTLQAQVNRAMIQQRNGVPLSQVAEGWFRELGEARAEQRRRREARAAEAAPSAADRVQDGGFEVTLPSGGTSGNTSGASEAQRLADEALRRDRRFEDDVARVQAETLEAQSRLPMTAEQRASAAMTLLDGDRQQRQLQLDRQVADGEITAAQRDQLLEAEKGAWLAKEANITATLQRSIMNDRYQAEDMTRGAALEFLAARAANAGTAEERLEIDRQILALHQQERRRALERALLEEGISDLQRQTIQALLDKLGTLEGEEAETLDNSGKSGVADAQAVIADLRRNAPGRAEKDRDDALDYIAQQEADGLLSAQAAADARAEIDRKYWQKRLTGEGSMLDQIAALQNSSNKKLAALGKAAAIAQATIDGYLAIQKAWGSAPFPYNLPAVAITTAHTASNIAAIAGMKDGGLVVGPGGGREDKVPRMLSNGEFVVNAAATTRNRALLEGLNSGSNVIAGLNGASASATGMARRDTTIHMKVDLKGARGDRQLMQAMQVAAEGAMEQAISEANKAVPGIVRRANRYRAGTRR